MTLKISIFENCFYKNFFFKEKIRKNFCCAYFPFSLSPLQHSAVASFLLAVTKPTSNKRGGISQDEKEDASELITDDDTTSYVKVDEIYDDDNLKFNRTNLTTLLRYITGNENAGVNDETMASISTMAENATTSADIREKVVGGKTSSQDVIVTLGGLDWQVVYLSKDNSGNSILTLWLSSSRQEKFLEYSRTEGTLYGFLNGSLYSDWSDDFYSTSAGVKYPSNMYGTSYIRAVTLNNGGTYATSTSASATAEQNESSVFAKFTMDGVEGSLTSFLVTPNDVSWQLLQSSPENNPSLSNLYPNDSINDPGILEGDYYSGFNYHSKEGYSAWANDYIWLPSLAETGYNSSNLGLWKTSQTQRQNISFSTSSITPGVGSDNSTSRTSVYNYSWLRSGHCNYAPTAGTLNPSGIGYNNYYVNLSYAVRPALHLNLNEVFNNTSDHLDVSTITLDSQNGSENTYIYQRYGVGFYSDSETMEMITSIETPTLTGYKFLGYYTSLNGQGTKIIDENGNFLVSNTYFHDHFTLFADWELGTYTISLNYQNGYSEIAKIYEKYNTGFYSNDATTNLITQVSLPTRDGHIFKGYYTGENGEGVMIIDESGVIVAEPTFTASDTEIFAYWKPNVPAYYDEEGDYWYIEYGKMPQERVENSTIITFLENDDPLDESDGVTTSPYSYFFAGLMLSAKIYDGEEYAYAFGNWYRVLPVRWRIEYNSNNVSNNFNNNGALAVMESVVYVGKYSVASLSVGEGYISANSEYSFADDYLHNFTLENKNFLENYTFDAEKFSATSRIEKESFENEIALASEEEILSTCGDFTCEFSDLVSDFLNMFGDGKYYFVRDLGSNLNTIECKTSGGVGGIGQRPTSLLGMRLTIKVSEYVCV